jgi:hypothetical protein
MRAPRVISLAVSLATAVTLFSADMKAQNNEMDRFAILGALSREEATAKARRMAEADFARKDYRILVVGRRPAKNAYDDFLKEKYGVLVTPIAGCIVSNGIIGAQEGYNSTMKILLNRKFGHDICKEAEGASRR